MPITTGSAPKALAGDKAYPDEGQAYPEGNAYHNPGSVISADTGKPSMQATLPEDKK